jgi:hypothetical protein
MENKGKTSFRIWFRHGKEEKSTVCKARTVCVYLLLQKRGTINSSNFPKYNYKKMSDFPMLCPEYAHTLFKMLPWQVSVLSPLSWRHYTQWVISFILKKILFFLYLGFINDARGFHIKFPYRHTIHVGQVHPLLYYLNTLPLPFF